MADTADTTDTDSMTDPGITFKSEKEKETLTALVCSSALTSFMGAALVKRYPKWGYRYMLATGLIASLATIAFSLTEVDDSDPSPPESQDEDV